MKTKRSLFQTCLLGGLLLIAATGGAQTFSTLRSFGVLTNVTGINPRSQLVQGADGTLYGTTSYGEGNGAVFKLNSDGTGFIVLKIFTNSLDGANPYAGLTLSGSVLYGTTANGGSSGAGTVFKVNTDGTGYTVLKNFTGGSDGNIPYGGLTLSGGVLYGTTVYGGSSGKGAVFKVNTDGTGYSVLMSFSSGAGAYPQAGLTLSGSVLYGTTAGSTGYGTVFKVNTDGTGYSVLKNFASSDGANPQASLILSGSVLYGTTSGGGSNYGTLFKINTDGTGYTVLRNFTSADSSPLAGLTLSGSVLYGTTAGGGIYYGTVFRINTDGTGYTVLKNFANSDGATPRASLVLFGSVLYGTTYGGGSSGKGTVFKVNTNGTGFTVLKHFNTSDGANPYSGLTLSGSALYGATFGGGDIGNGIIYQISLPIPPSITNTLTGATVFAGTSTNFTIGVSGATPFSYQWYSNSVPLANATNATLAFAPAATNHTGNYFVIVTNAYGAVTSSVVALTVIAQNPIITSQPVDQTLAIGSTASFAVTATGVPPLGYRWYFNNGLYAGATNSSLVFGPSFTNQAGNYQVIITNLYGSATSRVAALSVLLQPNAYGIATTSASSLTLNLASTPGSTNRVWTSTNLALPIAQWQSIATNIAGTNGLFQVTDTNLASKPMKFYRVSTP